MSHLQSVWDGMDAINESVTTANETADQKMTENLDQIMTMKTTNNEMNQSLVGDFIEQLGYTRVGTNEFTQVYDFIVNPLNLAEVDPNSNKLLTQPMGLQNSKDQVEKGTSITVYLLGVIVGLLSIIVIARLVALSKRR